MPYQFCNKGQGDALDVQRFRREVFADRTVTTDRYADGSFDQLISYPDGTFDTISGSVEENPTLNGCDQFDSDDDGVMTQLMRSHLMRQNH